MPDLSDPAPSERAQAPEGRATRSTATRRKGPMSSAVRAEPSEARGGLDATASSLRTVAEVDPGKLAQLLEGEIIPRLLAAHLAPPRAKAPKRQAAHGRFDARAADEFAQLVLTQDMPIVFDHVETLIDRGVMVEEVLLGLLAPTARRLGEYWLSDYCSFFDVTVGLGRLQQVLLALRLDGSVSENPPEPARTAFFATLEGETHGFGLLMVDEFFRRAGWRTVIRLGATPSEIASVVRGAAFEVVGFGASCDAGFSALGAVIKRVRDASRNRGVRVMVGGQIFLDRPDLGGVVGADFVASCAQDALSKAQTLILHQGGRG